MPTRYPSQQELQAYVGQHISKICPRGYSANSDNHCAHFVSHILGLSIGTTCGSMTRSTGAAASIRVHEVFHRCTNVGAWADLPSNVSACLVFMTKASNVNLSTKTMLNVPRKHVGIYLPAPWKIWHYSNSKHQVVAQRPDEFLFHYTSPDNAIFWGQLP